MKLNFLQMRVVILTLMFFGITAIGTIGYMFLEGWSVPDALYMTIITLTTVGFGETNPLSVKGRLFTIALIFGGVGIVAYTSTTLVQILVSGELRQQIAQSWRQRMLQKLKDHYIICGFGRMGRNVAEELARRKKAFVVIDRAEGAVEQCQALGYNVLLGNAANDDVLKTSGDSTGQKSDCHSPF